MLKKLFGGIDLNWKKLIISAVIIGVCIGVLISLPFFYLSYSFFTTACYILFAIIIMVNGKSPVDSALKCLVFFLIEGIIVYQTQIPFHREILDLERLMLYDGWIFSALVLAIWAYAHVGYYIKKKNIWSVLILLPAFILLDMLGLNNLRTAINYFPNNLLETILYFAFIVIIALGVFDDQKLRTLSLSFAGAFLAIYVVFFGGIILHEAKVDLSSYGVSLDENSHISFASYSPAGEADIVKGEDNKYELRIRGYRNGKVNVTIGATSPEYVECGFDIMGNFSVIKVDNK